MDRNRFKKIIVFTGGGIIVPQIAHDCMNAMLRLGAGAVTMKVHYDVERGPDSVADSLAAAIRDIGPDLIFSMDYGVVRELPGVFQELGVPVAAWFVDDPTHIIRSGNIIDNLYVFTWDRHYVNPLKEQGCGFVEYMPLATDPSVFRRIPPQSPECSEYSCDVSFVGSSLAGHSLEGSVLGIGENQRKELRECARRHAEMPHTPVEQLLREAEAAGRIRLDPAAREAVEAAVETEAMKLFRAGAVNSLADLAPRVYGDDGWEKLLAGGPVFSGPIDYEKDLNKLYSASRINLNVSKSQLITAVNQRVFDAPACGGFVLTDYREDAVRLFDAETEIAVYHSLEEMKELARYFLENEKERENRARAARRRVLAEHTYIHRMEFMLDKLSEAVPG